MMLGEGPNLAYLSYMANRLRECHRVLKNKGSIYLHCDPTMSHYLKVVMDTIFEHKNFRNEIHWRRNESGAKGSQHSARSWGSNVDSIFFYTKDHKSYFNPQIKSLSPKDRKRLFPKGTPEETVTTLKRRLGVLRQWNHVLISVMRSAEYIRLIRQVGG